MPVSSPAAPIEGRRPKTAAGREVLHLPFAVDRRVGDDGDRLLEVVGEVLALGRERCQRAVVAQRADRLGAVGGHLLDEFDVVALPAEAGEDAIGDLDRLLGPGVGVAGHLTALQRAAGLAGRGRRDRPPRPRCAPASSRGRCAASRRERAGWSAWRSRSIMHQGLLARGERLGLGDHRVDRDDARLGAEDEVVARSRPARAAAGRGRRRRRRTRRRGGRSAPPGPARTDPSPGAGTCRSECSSSGSERISSTIGGTTISIASARLRPSRLTRVSIVRLRSWESEEPGSIGTPSMRASWRSWAIVLISPLWPSIEKGWTRLKEGQVLVE